MSVNGTYSLDFYLFKFYQSKVAYVGILLVIFCFLFHFCNPQEPQVWWEMMVALFCVSVFLSVSSSSAIQPTMIEAL